LQRRTFKPTLQRSADWLADAGPETRGAPPLAVEAQAACLQSVIAAARVRHLRHGAEGAALAIVQCEARDNLKAQRSHTAISGSLGLAGARNTRTSPQATIDAP
jgi:hypothetical protein